MRFDYHERSPDHSGDCIHDPMWRGEYDHILIKPNPTTQYGNESKAYEIATGYSHSPDAWVCDTCIQTPGYFDQYLLYVLAMSGLEESHVDVPA